MIANDEKLNDAFRIDDYKKCIYYSNLNTKIFKKMLDLCPTPLNLED